MSVCPCDCLVFRLGESRYYACKILIANSIDGHPQSNYFAVLLNQFANDNKQIWDLASTMHMLRF